MWDSFKSLFLLWGHQPGANSLGICAAVKHNNSDTLTRSRSWDLRLKNLHEWRHFVVIWCLKCCIHSTDHSFSFTGEKLHIQCIQCLSKKKKKKLTKPPFFEALTEACTDRRPTCTLPTVPPGLRWAPGSCPPWCGVHSQTVFQRRRFSWPVFPANGPWPPGAPAWHRLPNCPVQSDRLWLSPRGSWMFWGLRHQSLVRDSFLNK